MIIRFKGGPGSGHRGHRGIPGKRGGSLPGKGGVRTYTDAKGTKIYVVHGGDELPDELVEKIKSVEDKMVRVAYNSETGNWHISTKDIWESDHGDFLTECLEGRKPKYPESIVARGVYSADEGLIMYDFSSVLEGTMENFLEERRLLAQADRALGKAKFYAFKVGGKVPPKVVSENFLDFV